ncbi:hypothetical protein DL93DRAFT_721458 [Clavulina sp. PMI_390]|nr:hypothetical protein DL93DRAFT_721458 [Clavulina sp. PMI_390]
MDFPVEKKADGSIPQYLPVTEQDTTLIDLDFERRRLRRRRIFRFTTGFVVLGLLAFHLWKHRVNKSLRIDAPYVSHYALLPIDALLIHVLIPRSMATQVSPLLKATTTPILTTLVLPTRRTITVVASTPPSASTGPTSQPRRTLPGHTLSLSPPLRSPSSPTDPMTAPSSTSSLMRRLTLTTSRSPSPSRPPRSLLAPTRRSPSLPCGASSRPRSRKSSDDTSPSGNGARRSPRSRFA